MKHLFISLIFSGLTLLAFAQELDVNYALSSNGATAVATTGDAMAAIDGDPGTRWESAAEDPHVWTLDLGQTRSFNTIKILWEGAYAQKFTISVSTDSVAWTPVVTIADQKLEGFPYSQIHTIDATTARYIQFYGEERGTPYGYSFWEFEVYTAGESILTTLDATIDANLLKVGESTAIQPIAKDQHGKVITPAEEVIYTITPAEAGTITNHTYTPSQIGKASITASIGELQAAAVEVVAYDGENLALSTTENNKIIAQSTPFTGYDAFRAVDGILNTEWQGCPDNGTLDTDSARTYDAWFVLDLGTTCDINMVAIVFEGACAQDYHVDFSADNATWQTAYNHVGNPGVHHHTQALYGDNLLHGNGVRYVRFWSTKAATQWGMKIFEFEVYGFAADNTATPELALPITATKVISNGQLIIIRDGEKYNVQGVRL